jgi:hypothetical protein
MIFIVNKNLHLLQFECINSKKLKFLLKNIFILYPLNFFYYILIKLFHLNKFEITKS